MGFMDKLAMVTDTLTFSLKAKNYGDKRIAEENVFLLECYTFASKGIIGRV